MDNASKTHRERDMGGIHTDYGCLVSRDVVKYVDCSVVGDSSRCGLGVYKSFRHVIKILCVQCLF